MTKPAYLGLLLSAICFLAMIGCLPARAQGTDVFREDFRNPQAAATKLNLKPDSWAVADGVLTSKTRADSIPTFTFGKPDWRNYDLEFKLRRTGTTGGDQHFGVRVRSSEGGYLQIYTRGDVVNVMEVAGGETLRNESVGTLPTAMETGPNAPWTSFRISLTDSTAKVYVNGALVGTVQNVAPRAGGVYFYAYNVTVQLDDLKATVLSTEEKGAQEFKPSANIAPNSSFEFSTQDNLPDYWGCPHWGIWDTYFVVHFDEWAQRYGLDTSTAYDGSRSMRVECQFDKPNAGGSALIVRSIILGSAANTQYVLSAYMKSKEPGVVVGMGDKQFTLTTDWQRYSVPFIQDGKSLYADMINIYPVSKGTYWIDAVQLEKGTEPTAYGPSLVDTVLIQQAKGSKAASQVPTCKPNKAKGKIKLDGVLNDADWQSCQQLDLRLLNGGEPSERTYAKITYDDKGIYVGVYCNDATALTAKCSETKRDGNVWNDPSIEIFVDPKLSKTNYYHFALNKANVQTDAYGTDSSWNCSWKTATHIGDNFWSAEAFLPFSELGIDSMVGERWGINVYRTDPQKNEYTCWSPTFASFHTPERFGQIVLDSRVLAPYRSRRDANLLAGARPEAIELIPQFTLYTSEKDMRIKLRLGLADQLIAESSATVSIDGGGKARDTKLSRENYITVPIAGLANGKHKLTAKVTNAAGKVVASASADFEKLPPQSNEVKIDRISRIVTVGGKPFVPTGCAWEGALPYEALKYLADSGCTALSVIFGIDQLGQVLDDAQKCDLKLKIGINATDLDQATQYINKFKMHPAVLAWDIFDEVFTFDWGKNNHKLVSDRCAQLKAIDPYHPVFINENEYGLAFLKGKGLSFPGEIVSLDYYAYPPSGNVPRIGELAKQMWQVGKSGSRPGWIYSFGAGYAFWASRDYTPEEQTCSTYLPLVNGVTGVFYFASHPKSKSNWTRIKQLMSEMKQLTPVLASPLDVGQVRCSSPTVQMLAKRYNGALYVLAINASKEPASARLDISAASNRPTKSTVLFEGRNIPVREGVITDKFKGFERHVYKVQ